MQIQNNRSADVEAIRLINGSLEPISSPAQADLSALLSRIGDAKVVLLGECTHGTKEFYDLRTDITMALVKEKGFQLVALEADWPDVEIVNAFIHGRRESWETFRRFPEWMWRNKSFRRLVNELRTFNASEGRAPVSIFGIDLYSLSSSMQAVLSFLQKRMPEEVHRALNVQECLEPWKRDPSQYGLAVWQGLIESCEDKVLGLLRTLHERRVSSSPALNGEFLSAFQNARILRNAEEYYRSIYGARVASWNLRDSHMFETLLVLLTHYGSEAKIVVWEHNSHLGNAAATEMGDIGEHNVGQLCKSRFGNACYSIGFMSDHGTVAAASSWNGTVEMKSLRPARSDSYEFLFHTTGVKNFFLPIRQGNRELKSELARERLERAIGVLYLPETERSSHYFAARLSEQFDEICWLDETTAVEPLPHVPEVEAPDTYPFGV